ncbi:MAG: type II toxin-antitoxin system VapC family toxin [Candidatus Verstraetearchaeota archaeon]|jgi:predicted nucleic acid-binding protein|nr:type II toxin-antitoxin system VapC family toxin [Candidatus Verstraetearchaeota archaeon]
MLKSEEILYLDTSALVKRYIEESKSDVVDEIFRDSYKGIKTLAFSYWNLAEAIVVFDKYEKKLGLNAKEIMKNMLREITTLSRLHRLIIVNITPSLLRKSINLILKYHIYVADALQIATAKKIKSSIIVTGDKELANIAQAEGLKVFYLTSSF